MISDRGFFILDRAIFDHPLFQDEFSDGWAFAWMLAYAAWKPKRVYVSGRWVELDRGQLSHSIRYMAARFKWSVKRVRCFTARLIKDGTISIGPKRGTAQDYGISVITICNYDSYQAAPIAKGTPKGTGGAQEGHKEEQGNKEDRDEMRLASENVSQNVSQPDFKKLASDLNDRIVIIFGFDPIFIPPGWCGLEHALQAGLRGNKWDPEICRVAAVKLAAKRKPDSFTYLIKAIHTEHQETAEMLKRMEAANVVQPNQRELALLAPISGGFARKGGGFAAVGQKAFKAGGRP